MKTFNIYHNLSQLNGLPADEAVEVFYAVSGSKIWAREMAERRPYQMLEQLFEAANDVGDGLNSTGEHRKRIETGLTKLLER